MQPFRFLDLPKELRLMVYERLSTTTVDDLHLRNPSTPHTRPDTYSQLIAHCIKFPAGLLATCKDLNAEAEPFFTKAFETAASQYACTFVFFLDLNGPGLEHSGIYAVRVLLNSIEAMAMRDIEELPATITRDISVHFGEAHAPAVIRLCAYAAKFMNRTSCHIKLKIRTRGRTQAPGLRNVYNHPMIKADDSQVDLEVVFV